MGLAVSSCARSSAFFSSSSFGWVSRAGLESRSSSSAWPSTDAWTLASLSPCCAFLTRFGHALLEALEVGEHQLGLDRLGVGDGIDPALDMGDVAAFEAAQHMDDGVDLADVGEELVAEALALRGAADQAGNVDELELGLDLVGRFGDLGDPVEPRIGHRDPPDIGLDRAERIIGRLRRRRLGQRVEQGGLADIRQPDDSATKTHRKSCELGGGRAHRPIKDGPLDGLRAECQRPARQASSRFLLCRRQRGFP